MKIAKHCICCDGVRLTATPAVLMPFVAKRVFDWEPVEITSAWGMRDLKAGHAYSVCNTLHCETCGAVFLDIRFDDDEMAALYRNYRDEAYTATRDRFEPGYRARNAILVDGSTYIPQVERFLRDYVEPPLRLLDWGGDTGRNTPFAGNLAIHHVYDISEKPTIPGAERVTAEQLRDTGYDLIVNSNVIEHVPYPRQTIDAMTALMTPDTILYVEVPYEDVMRAEQRPVDKKHWHEHVNFFSPRSLELLFQRCGLTVLGTIDLSVNAGGKDAHALGFACRLTRPL
ncbi:MAG TPA: class I SAM-dependent methyltransferase [Thermoanaerobaculia bacterium]|nr:class I SAM-dependent methyltransferase [Thermoanaerobaculia bacterium]